MSNTGGSKQVVTMGASFVNFLYIFFGSISLFFLLIVLNTVCL